MLSIDFSRNYRFWVQVTRLLGCHDNHLRTRHDTVYSTGVQWDCSKKIMIISQSPTKRTAAPQRAAILRLLYFVLIFKSLSPPMILISAIPVRHCSLFLFILPSRQKRTTKVIPFFSWNLPVGPLTTIADSFVSQNQVLPWWHFFRHQQKSHALLQVIPWAWHLSKSWLPPENRQ